MTEVARKLDDGSFKILALPKRRYVWHKPGITCPTLQWTPATGITRYEWARTHTPGHQVPFFEHLCRRYTMRPPTLVPDELTERMAASQAQLDNGMPGFTDEAWPEIELALAEHEINETDPTGEWRFHVYAARFGEGGNGIADRLAVSCCDYRTMPDWELLVRFRSWVLPDYRDAVIMMPAMTPDHLGRYENARFNNLQMISLRLRTEEDDDA